MHIMRNLPALFIVFLMASMSIGCSNSNRYKATVPPGEEEQTFNLVYQPGSEGRYADVISIADSLLGNCEMSDSLRAFIMIERNVALINMGNSEWGFNHADTLISFGRKAGINESVLQGMVAKGLVHRRKGNLDSAINYYGSALDIAMKENSVEWEQAIVEYLAVAYTEANRLTDGRQFSIRALDIAKEMGDTAAILQAVGTFASNLAKSTDYKATISELQPYKPLIEIAPPTFKIKILTPLVHAYLKLDSLAQARKVLAQAKEAAAVFPPNHFQAIITKLLEAKLCGAEKRYAEEYAIYQEVDSIGTIGRQSEDLFLEKAMCLSHLGRTDEAFRLMRDAYSALDSTRRSQAQKDMSDLAVKYDTLTKELEIERLAHQRWIMIFIISLCVVLIAVIIALFIYYRARSRRRLAQERREQYIQGLEEERGRIARELHDDIAGQLIGLQWEIPGMAREEAAERIIAIGQRVRTLSHEMMPPEFANRTFCQLLFDYAGNFNDRHSDRHITLTDEGTYDWDKLSVRQSYELYRIVQEAVNNALKHSESKEIRIILNGDERFSLSVENDIDGNGSVSDTTSSHAGSATLKKRAEIIGAEATAECHDGTYTLYIRQK